jgi:hypothetical protein
MALLVVLIVLTPLTVAWNWNPAVSIAMLFLVLILLLFAGQTVIFLLRLVAADRREGVRHVPRAAVTPTVGQLEDSLHVDALGRPLEMVDDGPGTPSAPDGDQPGAGGVRE